MKHRHNTPSDKGLLLQPYSRLNGVSRDTIYRHKRLIKQGGIDALRRKETPDLRHKNRPEEELEKVVIDFSLKNPHLGQSQISRQLKANMDIEISPNEYAKYGWEKIWTRRH
nr:helix-turn-helix domain-containing protein [Providencia rettgeri]